jgi:ferritin
MLTDKMEKALNDHLNAEIYSSYLYLSMSTYFANLNLSGSASWMKIQALEEMTHAMKFQNFIEERGGRVKLAAVAQPEHEWSSPLVCFADVLKHEQHVSGLVNELVALAMEEKDFASNNFLQWFVGEQVEEESAADDVVQTLKLAGEVGNGLFMVDRELGSRAFVMPPDITLNGLV